MKIATTMEYAATPEEVFVVLTDQAFQEAKCAATGAITYSASIKGSGGGAVITTERVLPAAGLPDIARSMVGETLKVVETQTWGAASADGSRTGTVEMSVAGVPVALTGTLALAPGGPGSVEHLDTDLKAKIPLIGGKIEKAAAKPIEDAIAVESRTVKEWLAR